MTYMRDLEEKGWQDWKANQERWKAKQAKDQAFIDFMTDRLKKKYNDFERSQIKDAKEGIKEFEFTA